MVDENRKWPTFLGIGVPKAGSTWLYELLKSHPEIWMPQHEREIHFFDKHYEEGLQWYAQYFPSGDRPYQAVGEITPHYFYCGTDRIESISEDIPSAKRFILLLRNPVNRLYSHYWFRRRIDGIDWELREFIEENPNALEWGKYAKHLRVWLTHFDRSQFLVLLTERDLGNVKQTRRKIASFLNVDPDLFPDGAGKSKANPRHLPQFRTLYSWAVELGRKLKRADINWPRKVARSWEVKEWFGKKEVDQNMDPELRAELRRFYADEMRQLEQMIDTDISCWDLI